MFENVSDEDVSTATDELIGYLGVKEETSPSGLVALLRKKDVQGCVREIAARLGLPIDVNLSYVPRDFRLDDTNRFRSSSLAQTDSNGRGIEGITAQVVMPEHLPMFGTHDLEGYPVQVRVSENCHAYPETFVAVMAHELSHVLLRSLRHPQKESELHTDVVPILLGFGDIIQRGRKRVRSVVGDGTTTTHTTTYGYLADSHFTLVRNKVRALLDRYRGEHNHLMALIDRMPAKLGNATRALERFANYLSYVDEHPPKRVKRGDAARLVQFHALDHAREWQISITQGRTALEHARTLAKPVIHYTSLAVRQIEESAHALELASEEIDHTSQAITGDLRILRKHVGLFHRLRGPITPRIGPVQNSEVPHGS